MDCLTLDHLYFNLVLDPISVLVTMALAMAANESV